jgi:hypothetical protein
MSNAEIQMTKECLNDPNNNQTAVRKSKLSINANPAHIIAQVVYYKYFKTRRLMCVRFTNPAVLKAVFQLYVLNQKKD